MTDTDTPRAASVYLASTPLFAGVERAALERFNTGEHWMHLAGGQTLFHQGDAADALYVIVRGSLHVILQQDDGHERLVDTLGRGTVVGEMAMISGDTRTATVVACRDSELVRIGRADFERLIGEYPSVAFEIARTLGARLKRTTRLQSHERSLRTIALFPLSPASAAGEFGARLAGALDAHGGACHVTPALVESMYPGAADSSPDAPEGRRLLQWMSGLEDRYRYVIYQADPSRPTWARRCLNQADVLLLAARAADDPAPGPLETALTQQDEGRTPVELVLLHEPHVTGIRGTLRWLEARRVAKHHHVRVNHADDYDRVARFLTGRAVGLVLSGGGARGFAHIGVIKAIREHGWPIDEVGGASMGAIVAAQCATGRSVPEMIALSRREFADQRDFDMTLPVASLNSAAATVRKMRRMFGDAQIEDLAIGYFCVSTNLSRARSIVHDRGPVWLWTRTSCSIPGLAPPVPYGGDLLVDGGVLNNLPADVMRERCNGLVIGVDVTPGVDLQTTVESRPHMSGWPLLWERLTPSARATAFPTIVDILSRTAIVGSMRDASRMQGHCDIYLQPKVERFRMTDFREIDALIAEGYRAAQAALAAHQPGG